MQNQSFLDTNHMSQIKFQTNLERRNSKKMEEIDKKKRWENLKPSGELIGKNTNFLKITTFDTNPNQTLQIVFSCQIQSGLKHQFYRFKITLQSCFSRQICDHFHFNRLTKPQKFTRAVICLEVVDKGISNISKWKS